MAGGELLIVLGLGILGTASAFRRDGGNANLRLLPRKGLAHFVTDSSVVFGVAVGVGAIGAGLFLVTQCSVSLGSSHRSGGEDEHDSRPRLLPGLPAVADDGPNGDQPCPSPGPERPHAGVLAHRLADRRPDQQQPDRQLHCVRHAAREGNRDGAATGAAGGRPASAGLPSPASSTASRATHAADGMIAALARHPVSQAGRDSRRRRPRPLRPAGRRDRGCFTSAAGASKEAPNVAKTLEAR